VIVAACAAPAGPSSATDGLTVPSVSPPASALSASPVVSARAACALSEPVAPALPPSLAKLGGVVGGLTDQGELLVKQSHPGGPADTLTVFNPRTGAVQAVVSRPPQTYSTAKSQIGAASGNAGWIVWDETGFSLEVGDWTIWAMNRRSGKVRKVASFEPGANGRAVPGFATGVSLLGDLATWSADIEVPGNKTEPRIYLADLHADTVRRLDTEAKWPSLTTADELDAAVAVGRDTDGKVLARPGTIKLTDATVTTGDWIQPTRVLGASSSASGTVLVRLVKAATADDPLATADIVTHDAAGATRTFSLPNGWGDVAAGEGFLAWLDERHLWILPSGQAEPTKLVELPDDTMGVGMVASGPNIYWWTDSTEGRLTERLARIVCG
jgi:hypothetical protein